MPTHKSEWKTFARKKQSESKSNLHDSQLENEMYSQIQREITCLYDENQGAISFAVSNKHERHHLKEISVNSIFQVAYSLQQPIIQNKKSVE